MTCTGLVTEWQNYSKHYYTALLTCYCQGVTNSSSPDPTADLSISCIWMYAVDSIEILGGEVRVGTRVQVFLSGLTHRLVFYMLFYISLEISHNPQTFIIRHFLNLKLWLWIVGHLHIRLRKNPNQKLGKKKKKKNNRRIKKCGTNINGFRWVRTDMLHMY